MIFNFFTASGRDRVGMKLGFFHTFRGVGGIFPKRLKENPPMSPFLKGGFKRRLLFKDKLLVYDPLPTCSTNLAKKIFFIISFW